MSVFDEVKRAIETVLSPSVVEMRSDLNVIKLEMKHLNERFDNLEKLLALDRRLMILERRDIQEEETKKQ